MGADVIAEDLPLHRPFCRSGICCSDDLFCKSKLSCSRTFLPYGRFHMLRYTAVLSKDYTDLIKANGPIANEL